MSHLPGLSEETIDNLFEANESPVRLKRIPDFEHVFLSEYENTGRGRTLVMLSRVGYNAERTQALVEMGATSAPLSGSGALYFLKLIDGSWRIENSVLTWIS